MSPPRPSWIRARAPGGEQVARLLELTRRQRLHTVCQGAHCPNLGECWGRGTATFLLLGPRCTRTCAFCAVAQGAPSPPDPGEPQRAARATAALGLRHAVITSVTRDDLPDGGAGHFAATVREIRRHHPGCSVEVLVPDFGGELESLRQVLAAAPEVLGHNLETVPRLYPLVRPQADYRRSLSLLACAAREGSGRVKSGLMVGLGESRQEVLAVLADLRRVGVSLVTVGQYLPPSARHLPVRRYWHPRELASLERAALRLGFTAAACAPLVRSSYHADRMLPSPVPPPTLVGAALSPPFPLM